MNVDYQIMTLRKIYKHWNGALELKKKKKKENKELKTINSMQKYRIEVIDERELISKKEIREFIKKELPDDEIMECCSICDVNGVAIRKELEKLLNKE